jgi:hypothetical protein
MSLFGLFALLSLYVFHFFGVLSLFLFSVTEVAKLCSKLQDDRGKVLVRCLYETTLGEENL